jgi:spermidine synthase
MIESKVSSPSIDNDRIDQLDQQIDGWFREVESHLWPGQSTMLRVKEILYHEKSEFQDILIFETTNHGRVLALDGVIQCADRDEFA